MSSLWIESDFEFNYIDFKINVLQIYIVYFGAESWRELKCFQWKEEMSIKEKGLADKIEKWTFSSYCIVSRLKPLLHGEIVFIII